MSRRPKIQKDTETLCNTLIHELQRFQHTHKSITTPDRVRLLVNAHHLLRDLGVSIAESDADSARQRILDYFLARPGQIIEGDELMVISGISEYARRVRELRIEHGWPIITGNSQITHENDGMEDDPISLKPDEYILLSVENDSTAVERWKLAKKIRNENISVREKIIKYFLANIGKPIPGDELDYLAKDRLEWPRRVRELRTQFGWNVVTKATGRPDLPVGVYVLESDRQAPEHDRNIKDSVRREVLRRDGYCCQDCRWSHNLWNKSDPRHLEVHHIIMHVQGGANTADNLITLCNICHDKRHINEKLL
jgi:hypothetical protein